jgi:hypothetical protein
MSKGCSTLTIFVASSGNGSFVKTSVMHWSICSSFASWIRVTPSRNERDEWTWLLCPRAHRPRVERRGHFSPRCDTVVERRAGLGHFGCGKETCTTLLGHRWESYLQKQDSKRRDHFGLDLTDSFLFVNTSRNKQFNVFSSTFDPLALAACACNSPSRTTADRDRLRSRFFERAPGAHAIRCRSRDDVARATTRRRTADFFARPLWRALEWEGNNNREGPYPLSRDVTKTF